VSWWTGGALGLDFETDGPEPTEARAITCALVNVTPGNPPQPMELMLQPERDIPEGAAAIHGITTERARAEGVLREAGIAQIVATIAELVGPERPVVGHNVGSYDLTLLDREMRRLGLGRLERERNVFGTIDQVRLIVGDDLACTFPVIDTLVLDKAVDKYRKGKRKLEVTAAHYGVPMAEGSAHGATADVVASIRIAIAIANRYAATEIGAMRLPDLHCAQVRWAGEQAAGLADYFRRSGKTEEAEGVSGEWPFRSFTD
jgi:DNA polymerase III epsilon subunit-like protein